MQSTIEGKAYVLGDNVDTDQIIPAHYLTFDPAKPDEYRMFGKFALSGVPAAQGGLPKGHVPFHAPGDEFVSPYKIIVGGKNFGCGSSREHAPIALDAAGIEAVVAEFYARIFFRNSVNGGYLLPLECVDRLCDKVVFVSAPRAELNHYEVLRLSHLSTKITHPAQIQGGFGYSGNPDLGDWEF